MGRSAGCHGISLIEKLPNLRNRSAGIAQHHFVHLQELQMLESVNVEQPLADFDTTMTQAASPA